MNEGLEHMLSIKGLSAEQYEGGRKTKRSLASFGDLRRKYNVSELTWNQLDKLAWSEGLDDDEEEELLQVLRDAKTEAEKARTWLLNIVGCGNFWMVTSDGNI